MINLGNERISECGNWRKTWYFSWFWVLPVVSGVSIEVNV